MLIDRWTTVQNFAESFEDLSPAQINAMSFEEWAARTNRRPPAEAALAALDAQYEAPAPEGQEQPPAPVREPQQPDVADMSWQEYAAYREASGIAEHSNEGMSRAEVQLMSRLERRNIPPTGRTAWYSGQ
jgi:hypothetical protein